MRVVLNGLAALKPKTGVGHHVAELAAALHAGFPDDQFRLYPGDLLGRVVRTFNPPPRPPDPRPPRPFDRLRGWVKAAAKTASRFHFSAFTRAHRFDLYHEPNFVPYPTPLPTVVTVHDLSVLKYPHWHPADRVRQHQRFFLRGVGRARHVIVVSEAVRRELIEELGCPPGRVTTVHNGIAPRFAPQPAAAVTAVCHKFDLPPRFLLCVGTVEPRKNLGTVIRAFADLPAAAREACPLVLAGPWGWRSEADRHLYESVGRPAGVRHVGYVPAADLPALYSAAHALLYPSHYEGFGLPPVEMLACGGGVIASTAEAVREVLGPHGWFVEPEDVAGWRDALRRAATDDDFVAGLRAGGVERARRFTWQRAATETVAVYRHVLGQTAAVPPHPLPESRVLTPR
jgi:alpha-1,3-rhamnosyl/mannosyltransferase